MSLKNVVNQKKKMVVNRDNIQLNSPLKTMVNQPKSIAKGKFADYLRGIDYPYDLYPTLQSKNDESDG